jgi:hypothetical protein
MAKPQPRATHLRVFTPRAGAGLSDLVEAFEYPRLVLLGDSAAVVGDLDPKTPAIPATGNCHVAARCGELDRVVHKVVQRQPGQARVKRRPVQIG